ncbi:hypothetical protein [Nocardia sp. NBC_01009]|uniref:hypothetical protein n=1 Tax=Nocardia sp. NBC_01009 TaxID=2975996 RepID=UPI003865F578|nr:hypothetical protein OHA42_18330 [Nocardia sp. NBC_01009]
MHPIVHFPSSGVVKWRQRQARAEEVAARSRAAKAEAEVKAAQAEQLAQQAQVHRSEAADSRTELDKEWERADKVDPDSKSSETQQRADPEQPSRTLTLIPRFLRLSGGREYAHRCSRDRRVVFNGRVGV